jgi:hypothetical protein
MEAREISERKTLRKNTVHMDGPEVRTKKISYLITKRTRQRHVSKYTVLDDYRLFVSLYRYTKLKE